jgi:hypothetical protein
MTLAYDRDVVLCFRNSAKSSTYGSRLSRCLARSLPRISFFSSSSMLLFSSCWSLHRAVSRCSSRYSGLR